MRPVVFVFRAVDAAGTSHTQMASAGCIVEVAGAGGLVERAGSGGRVDALVGATYPGGIIGRDLLDTWPDLRIVAKYTIGVDDVDVGAASSLGILVTHAPTEANWGGVAEGTVALLLTVLKKTRERDGQVKRGRWRSDALQGVYLGARGDGYPGLTVGIVGLGRAGGRVADLLAPWGMRVLACDPYIPASDFAAHGAERADLETLLRESDIVTLHCNLTDETRNMLDARRLALMKPSALLINTARGAIVELEALCDALDSNQIAAAALDVFPEEPLPAGHRIFSMGARVCLSPHMVAANEGGTLAAAIPWTTDAVLAALGGSVPQHVYNVEAIPKWLERFGGRSLL